MKRKIIMTVLCVMITASMLAGCASTSTNATTTNATTTQTVEETTQEAESVLGQITAISDDTITLALGTEKEMTMPDGEAPDGEAPDGEAPTGEAPSGDKGGKGGGQPGGLSLDLTGEEQTITITEDTIIAKESSDTTEEATVDDLTDGTIIEVTLDGDTALNIVIHTSEMGGGKPEGDTTAK